MRISTLGYVGKQGVKNIGRNKMFSIAAIATMSACIFLFGLFASILLNFQYIIKTAEEGVAITVFFNEDATEDQISNIGKQLESRDDVLEVKYVSADDAWDKFKDEYFAEFLPDYQNLDELKEHYQRGGLGDVKVKKFLNKVLEAELGPIRERRKMWEQRIPDVYDILQAGSEVAEKKAAETLNDVREAMKINYFDGDFALN